MTPEEWTLARAVFEEALHAPPDGRGALLDDRLAGRPEARAEVERMLAAEPGLGDFLEPPGVDADGALARSAGLESYEIRRPLGEGGMGVVYEAEQRSPKRRVALKILRAGVARGAALNRFRDEVALLARLQHPGIAQIFEAGVSEHGPGAARFETPWFAMELVEGALPLVEYAAARDLGLQPRLELFRDVCDAVHHGHQRGVLHRDLKPANLLVDRDGRVKVIDFGVARATDAEPGVSDRTREGEIVGTLLYMSPERISGPSDDLDIRTDVYSLGVVLYELLCEAPPFHLEGVPITRAWRMLCDEEPAPPSARRAGLPQELDWIVARAMAKRRDERYGTAAELSAELERLARHEPLHAGPETAAYRVRKFVRRHRGGVAAAALVAVIAVIGFAGTLLGLFRALDAERVAQDERAVARSEASKAEAVTDFLVEVLSAPDPSIDGREVRVVQVLERATLAHEERFADEPEVRMRLALALGSVYHGLGLDDAAERELGTALELARASHGASSSQAAQMLGNLGEIATERGRFEEANAQLSEALAVYEAAGDEGEWLYRTWGRLGQLRLVEGRPEEAEALLRPAVEGMRSLLGELHRETLLLTNALAGALHEARRLDEAEPLYRRALEGLRETLGDEHPDALRLRANFAMLLFGRGQVDEALDSLRIVYEVRERLVGPDHPDTLATLANYTGALHLSGRVDEAEPLYTTGVERMERALPPEHPVRQAFTMNAAQLARDRGRHGRAEELYLAVHDLRSAAYGPGAPTTINALYALAQLARESGRLEVGEERTRRGLDLALEHQGPDHHFVYQFRRELARTLAALGRFEEAEEELGQVLAMFERLGADDPAMEDPGGDFVALYERWGREDEAERFRKGR